jgi:precorrin-6Y C5,15-methyltransferase (decarboxylating)
LIGVLDDGWASLSDAARRRVETASVVIGAKRTLALAEAHLSPEARRIPMDGALSRVPEWVERACIENRAVVVLATGDPLCRGVGGVLSEKLRGTPAGDFEILPNVSVLQLACARFHQTWDAVRIASCHARDAGEWTIGAPPSHALYPAMRAIARYRHVFVFTGPENTPARLARALLCAGYASDEVAFSVACRLQGPDERLFQGMTLDEAARTLFPEPNVVLVRRGSDDSEGADVLAEASGEKKEKKGIRDLPIFGFDDSGYLQRAPEKGLITKQEARVLALAKMRLSEDSVVWDIGAGAGSVGVEAARLAVRGHVWAIEKNPDDAANARANARRLQVTNYTLCEGKAPDGLDAWPNPDAVFVGGSGGNLPGLISAIFSRLNLGGRVVMNFVLLENLATATVALDAAGLCWDLVQLQASRSRPMAGMHRMAAQNPVWILTAYAPEK